jgi:hypothetical protein
MVLIIISIDKTNANVSVEYALQLIRADCKDMKKAAL